MITRNFETPYGYFSEDGKEYIIKKPQTPRPWINIISNSKNYGLAISQAGSGYSWYIHARENRITRWNQDLVRDNWGKFIYIRDNKKGQFWSSTYQPVKKTSKHYRCRHGLGYTTFENIYNDILSTLTIFVPPDDSLEIWLLTLENQSSRKRDISLFTYLEWALGIDPNVDKELRELFIESKYETKQKALFATKRLYPVQTNNTITQNKLSDYIAFHACNIKPTSWDSDKEKFLGLYRNFDNPIAVSRGNCFKSEGKWNDSIASLHVNIKLNSKQKKKLFFVLGSAKNKKEAERLIAKYNSISVAEEALSKTQKMWLDMCNTLEVDTPDKGFNIINNYWLKYQTISARLWGRSSYYQIGGDYDFRDQLQDSQIYLTINPKLTKEKILLSASHQFKDGTVQHWWNPLSDTGSRINKTDDHLWLPYVVINYLKETADYEFLKEKAGYLDSNRRTSIYDHCLKSIDCTLNRLSSRGLPLVGEGDWNGSFCRAANEYKGESIWLGHFLYGILSEWSYLLFRFNKKKIAQKLKDEAQVLKGNINKYGWDDKWYTWAITDDGVKLGSKTQQEAKIFLNAQTWAIINKVVPPSRLKSILNSLDKYLYFDFGPILLYPAFVKSNSKIEYLSRYAPGTRENGGLCTRAACWTVIAEVVAGRPEIAWDLYNRFLPIRRGMNPDLYKTEPYVTSGNTDGPDSKNFGQGGWSWYSGSACWLFKVGIEWLLGIRAEYDGLKIDPILPDDWSECYVKRVFRKATYKISIIKYDGPDQIIVDGKIHRSNIIPAFSDRKEHNVIFRTAKNYPLRARRKN